MVDKTTNYQMEPFTRGSLYSARSDLRRFVTMDNNLESYVGIIGGGIITGWEIEKIDGNMLRILPGTGLNNGYSTESPYEIKRRSEMVLGEREIHQVRFNDEIQGFLTGDQKNNYVAVIQDYDPSYVASPSIEDTYVKVVIPYEIALPPNGDFFIFAAKYSSKPYPELADYSHISSSFPNISDFNSYAAYVNSLNEYKDNKNSTQGYQWQLNPDNHFTSCVFSYGSNINPTSIVLGKITVRKGDITKIKRDDANILYKLQSPIKNIAKSIIPSHNHGGSKEFDPPKIKLNSVIRSVVYSSYNESSKRIVYRVLNEIPTSLSKQHRHSFYVDANGDGYTVEVLGDSPQHFHRIENFVIQNVEETDAIVPSHIHFIDNINEATGIIDDPLFEDNLIFSVYQDNVNLGNNNNEPSFFSFQASENLLYVYKDKIKNFQQPKKLYSIDFARDEYRSEKFIDKNFQYSSWNSSLFDFMFQASIQYSKYLRTINRVGLPGGKDYESFSNDLAKAIEQNLHPFICYGEIDGDTTIYGFNEVRKQSEIGDLSLKNNGDVFKFTFPASNGVKVMALNVEAADPDYVESRITMNVFGEQEVEGKISENNILYFHASKILYGKFQPEQIPIIDHVGRFLENCEPYKQKLTSYDGIQYEIVPSRTGTTDGHYHFLNIDGSNLNGFTETTNIGEDIVFSILDDEGNEYEIDHIHQVSEGKVQDSNDVEFNEWRAAITDSNLEDIKAHTHRLQPIYSNPSFIIYSSIKSESGDIFLGTSNGLVMIPQNKIYEISINELQFFVELPNGANILDSYNVIKTTYERIYKETLFHSKKDFLDNLKDQVDQLSSHNDSIVSTAYNSGNVEKLLIIKKEYVNIDTVYSYSYKEFIALKDSDLIINYRFVRNTNSLEFNPNSSFGQELLSDGDYYVELYTKSELALGPIWDLKFNNGSFYAVSPNGVFSFENFIIDIQEGVKSSTNDFDNYGLNKIYFYEQYSWLLSNNGLFKGQEDPFSFSYQELLGIIKAKDLIVIEDVILLASNQGLFVSNNFGKTWELKQKGNFNKIILDGPKIFVMGVAEKNDKKRRIYLTNKLLNIWIEQLVVPNSLEIEDTILFNDIFYAISNNGLVSLSNDNYYVIIREKFSSITLDDSGEILLGGHGKLVSTFDLQSFEVLFSFEKIGGVQLKVGDTFKESGYAYFEKNKSLYFKEPFVTNEEAFVIVNYNEFLANNGSWEDESEVKVYMDGTSLEDSSYKLDPKSGSINFGGVIYSGSSWEFLSPTIEITSTESTEDSNADADVSIETESTEDSNADADVSIEIEEIDISNFKVGDLVFVTSEATFEEPEKEEESKEDSELERATKLLKYLDELKIYHQNLSNVEKMKAYGKVLSVGSGSITLDYKSHMNLLPPLSIQKIPIIHSDNKFNITIQESYLYNKGDLSHADIEDQLSLKDDFKPFNLSSVYLNNLLELAQGVKYVYPDITSKLRNSLFYDMHYQNEEDLGKEIDVQKNEIYNQTFYKNDKNIITGSVINSIHFGSGSFFNKVFVGTSIGLFYSELTSEMEKNWTYVPEIPYNISDINSFSSTNLEVDHIIVSTPKGTFISNDIENWERQILTYTPTKISKRFKGGKNVSIPSHSASWETSVEESGTYTVLKSLNGTYEDLKPNRILKITIDGISSVHSLISKGKFNDWIRLSPIIEVEGDSNNVEVIEDRWWGLFNYSSINGEGNSSFPNPLILGGINKMSSTYNFSPFSWEESTMGDGFLFNYSIKDIKPISNGSILSLANSTINTSNYILESKNIGSKWNSIREFKSKNGKILSISLSDYGHSIAQVEWTNFNNSSIIGELAGNEYVIYNNNTIIEEDFVLFNNENEIVLFGDKAFNNKHLDLTLEIKPSSLNSIVEHKNNIFIGTNKGLFYDKGSYFDSYSTTGNIGSINPRGFIEKINKSASIKKYKFVNNQYHLTVISDDPFYENELTNQKALLNKSSDYKFRVVSNSSKNINKEFTIKIELIGSDFNLGFFQNSKIYFTSQNSSIKIKFNKKIDFEKLLSEENLDQYLNQNEEEANSEDKISGLSIFDITEDNFGQQYKVVDYFNEGIIIKYTHDFSKTSLKEGGEVILDFGLDYFEMYGNLPNSSYENEHIDKSIQFFDSNGQSLLANAKIISNSKKSLRFQIDIEGELTLDEETFISENNSIVENTSTDTDSSNFEGELPLDSENYGEKILDLVDAKRFVITGLEVKPVSSFQNKRTSIQNDHYHDINILGYDIEGKVLSIPSETNKYITFETLTPINIDLIQKGDKILKGATVYFWNTLNLSTEFKTTIVDYG